MSVLAFISTPQNEYEKSFAVPVATERIFCDCWVPTINALNLKWVTLFSSGIEITEEDLNQVIPELLKVKIWAQHNLSGGYKLHITEHALSYRKRSFNRNTTATGKRSLFSIFDRWLNIRLTGIIWDYILA